MARETKIGLLVGLLFIVAFGLVLSGIMPKETPSAISPEMRTQGPGSPVATRPLTVSQDGAGDGWSVVAPPAQNVQGGADALPGGPVVNGTPGRVEVAVVGPAQMQTGGPVESPITQAPVRPSQSSTSPVYVSPGGTRTVTYETTSDMLAELRNRASEVSPVVTTPPVQPVAQPPAPVAGQKYVVKQGDTLYAIAKQYYGNGMLHPRIAAVNASVITNPPNVTVGMELVIPPLETGPAMVPSPAPNRPSVVPAHVSDSAVATGGNNVRPLVVVEQPAPAPVKATHTVKAGDTLSAIARANASTADELARINGLANPNAIRVGQVLKLAR